MGQESADRRRRQRIEELRADLSHTKKERVDYARKTLLTMLWLDDEQARRQVISALCRYQPEEGQPYPAFALRLSGQLAAPSVDRATPPTPEALATALGETTLAIMNVALQQIKLKQIKLKQIKSMPAATDAPDEDGLYLETDVCRDALVIAQCFQLTAVVEPTVQILRLFPPDLARGAGPLARQTGPLRESAAHLLGSLSPDALYAFWYALGSPDKNARQDLLPVLDYLNDLRATPYLVRLFERRSQWSDAEMVGWFAVRAFKRIRDRRALAALRRVISAADGGSAVAMTTVTSPDLVREVRRAIEAIQYGHSGGAKEELLRGSQPPTTELLRSSAQGEADLVRPADPRAYELLRGAPTPTDHLLHAVDALPPNGRDRTELIRAHNEPTNPFENFNPAAEF
jgi:hypothetical protein